jgi:uncharacterized protein (TIGR00288 family)
MGIDSGKKLAVLIDAENISSKYIKTILDEASNVGNIIIKRIYGNWTNNQMAAWKDVILDNSIQPIQQYSNTIGKNSSDSSMIIDAMDLMHSGRIDGFCVVSSDSDFTRLAARMREDERYVIGMGEQKTPKSFINACDKFLYLDLLYSEGKAAEEAAIKEENTKKPVDVSAKPPIKPVKKADSDSAADAGSGKDRKIIMRTVKALIDENSDDDGWIFSGMLGSLLLKRFPDFDVRNFGFTKFNLFIESDKMFEVKRNSNNVVSIRLKESKK